MLRISPRRMIIHTFVLVEKFSFLHCHTVEAGGTLLLPRIFPSYFANNISALFVVAFPEVFFSNFSELLHSVIYDERFRGLSEFFCSFRLISSPQKQYICCKYSLAVRIIVVYTEGFKSSLSQYF